MKRIIVVGAVLLGGVLTSAVSVAWAEDPGSPDRERIDRLIRQLGSDAFTDRAKAANDLDAAGPAALAALRLARASADPEVRRRAEEIVARIDRRMERDHLLTPRLVHVKIDNLSVASAAEEFGKQTGIKLNIRDPRKKLATRKVSLDTGDVPFWSAVDAFCARADLYWIPVGFPAENGPNSAPSGTPPIESGQALPDSTAMRRLTLTSEPITPLPSFDAGALRIQVLPPGAEVPGGPTGGDASVVLIAHPDPGLGWMGMNGVRVEQAVDDRGRIRSQLEPAPTRTEIRIVAKRRLGGMRRAVLVEDDSTESSYRAVIALKSVDGPARALTELRGTLSAFVQTPNETLITVDDLVAAGRKSFEHPDGATLEVFQAVEDPGGELNLTVRLNVQPGVQVSALDIVPATKKASDRKADKPAESPRGLIFGVSGDFRENRCRLRESRVTVTAAGGAAYEIGLVLPRSTDGGGPLKLVLRGSRKACIDIPFTLRDVPLR